MINSKQQKKKAHQQIAAVSMASLLLLSLFSVLLITDSQDSGVTGFVTGSTTAPTTATIRFAPPAVFTSAVEVKGALTVNSVGKAVLNPSTVNYYIGGKFATKNEFDTYLAKYPINGKVYSSSELTDLSKASTVLREVQEYNSKTGFFDPDANYRITLTPIGFVSNQKTLQGSEIWVKTDSADSLERRLTVILPQELQKQSTTTAGTQTQNTGDTSVATPPTATDTTPEPVPSPISISTLEVEKNVGITESISNFFKSIFGGQPSSSEKNVYQIKTSKEGVVLSATVDGVPVDSSLLKTPDGLNSVSLEEFKQKLQQSDYSIKTESKVDTSEIALCTVKNNGIQCVQTDTPEITIAEQDAIGTTNPELLASSGGFIPVSSGNINSRDTDTLNFNRMVTQLKSLPIARTDEDKGSFVRVGEYLTQITREGEVKFYDEDLKLVQTARLSETGSLEVVDSVGNTITQGTSEVSNSGGDVDPARSSTNNAEKPTPILSQFNKFRNEYAQYQGVSGFSSLFFSQEFLASWRNNVEKVFAETYLGTQYWSSALCAQAVDGKNEGFVFATTPQGLSELAAFVKATRSPEAIDENGKKTYIYFIEVRVKNGNSEKDLTLLPKLVFNVELQGDKTTQLFSSKKEVERGKEFKKLGKDAIVQDSSTKYTKICLVLDEVPAKWRIPGKSICSPIPDNTGTPTSVAASATTGGSSAPAAPEVNDI